MSDVGSEADETRRMGIQEDICRAYNVSPPRANEFMLSQKMGMLSGHALAGSLGDYDKANQANFILGAVTMLAGHFRSICRGQAIKTTSNANSACGALANAIEMSERVAQEIERSGNDGYLADPGDAEAGRDGACADPGAG